MSNVPGDPGQKCHENSISHELLTKCYSEVNFCYATKDGRDDDLLFCNRSIEPNGPQHPSDKVTKAPITYTRHVSKSDPLWEAYRPCFVAEYAHATNTAVIGYVNKNDGKAACDHQMSEYCQTKECLDSIIPVFEEEHAGCKIDPTMPIKGGYEDTEWWRWLRENRYTSTKGEGWLETHEDDDSLLKYAKPRCKFHSDCDTAIQYGVCDNHTNKCTIGPKIGHECTTDGTCGEPIKNILGKCVNDTCEVGKNGIEPVYHIPKQCKMPAENSKFAYEYCGFDEKNLTWTGVCTEYTDNGQVYHGCKPFRNSSEIANVQLRESEHRSDKKIVDNFANSRYDAPWDHLRVCVPDHPNKRNGLSKVCLQTHYTVNAYTRDKSCETLLPQPNR